MGEVAADVEEVAADVAGGVVEVEAEAGVLVVTEGVVVDKVTTGGYVYCSRKPNFVSALVLCWFGCFGICHPIVLPIVTTVLARLRCCQKAHFEW